MKKSSRWIFVSLLIVIIFSGGVAGLIHYKKKPGNHPFRRGDFGISIPGDYSIHGIDVSRYQGKINWKKVKNSSTDDCNLHFVFVKATEGTELLDPHFKNNWKESKKHGFVRGAYHFFLPKKDPYLQADHFIRNVRITPGDLPPVLDVEVTGNKSSEELQKRIQIWLSQVEEHYGVKPVIYTGKKFYETHIRGRFDNPVWIAHYYRNKLEITDSTLKFWQHSDKGKLDGIKGAVDFNVFKGDFSEFSRLRFKYEDKSTPFPVYDLWEKED